MYICINTSIEYWPITIPYKIQTTFDKLAVCHSYRVYTFALLLIFLTDQSDSSKLYSCLNLIGQFAVLHCWQLSYDKCFPPHYISILTAYKYIGYIMYHIVSTGYSCLSCFDPLITLAVFFPS